MRIAIPLFDRVTALDAIGPYEVWQRIPEVDVVFVGLASGSVRTENGMLGLTVDAELEDVPEPDLVCFPGGRGTRALLDDRRLSGWLRPAAADATLVTSVCTGSLVLAAAGLLDGLTATTHWAAADELTRAGATYVSERVVPHWDRRIVTAAGVSSGIDMALEVAARLFDPVTAQAAQLLVEYDPQPPFTAGSVADAGPEVLARAKELAARRD